VEKISEGANANVSRLSAGVHTGTQVDAPVHFIDEAAGVETLPLNVLIGAAQVVELAPEVDLINREVVQSCGLISGVERVLFKTRNSQYWSSHPTEFQTGFAAISEDGAEELVRLNVQLVGIDYLSIAPYKHSRPTHQTLLQAKMVVIEGLNLSEVVPGVYQLVCLPLKLGGSDGAPARTVLLEQ
jgi:arylformamidase